MVIMAALSQDENDSNSPEEDLENLEDIGLRSSKKPKKRTSRACDKCNQLKTKCDGEYPCSHCQKLQSTCTYLRTPQKRGKASEAYKKSLQEKAKQNKDSATALPIINVIPSDFYIPQVPVSVIKDERDQKNIGAEPPSFLRYSEYPTVKPSDPFNLFGKPLMPEIARSQEMRTTNAKIYNSPNSIQSPRSPAFLSARRGLPQNEALNWKYPSLSAVAPHLNDKFTVSLIEDTFEEYMASERSDRDILFLIIRKSSLIPNPDLGMDARSCDESLALSIVWHAVTRSSQVDNNTKQELSAMFETILLSELVLPSTFDDVIASIQMADIYSNAGYRTVAVKIWRTAMYLARQLQLNIESSVMSPERCEERRRTWWYLYLVDRHLAFLFDTSLVLLDKDCLNLRPICSTTMWSGDTPLPALNEAYNINKELPKGVVLEIEELGFFSCFTPLSCILGLIVDAHHMFQHPFLETGENNASSWKTTIQQSISSIEEALNTKVPETKSRNGILWLHYSYFALHVVTIFADAPWDPAILLAQANKLDMNVINIMYKRCVLASRSLEVILSHDNDLESFPAFYSVYLYQATFVVLILAGLIDLSRDETLKRACEILLQMHHQCITRFGIDFERDVRDALESWLLIERSPDENDARQKAEKYRYRLLNTYKWTQTEQGIIF